VAGKTVTPRPVAHGTVLGSGIVIQQLEPVYLASCPFCDYRAFFSSKLSMLATYGTHLLGHEAEVIEERRLGGNESEQWMEGVAQHLQRLNTAPYN
jgi:hypothetical protein